jgi:hypothetical protein
MPSKSLLLRPIIMSFGTTRRPIRKLRGPIGIEALLEVMNRSAELKATRVQEHGILAYGAIPLTQDSHN